MTEDKGKLDRKALLYSSLFLLLIILALTLSMIISREALSFQEESLSSSLKDLEENLINSQNNVVEEEKKYDQIYSGRAEFIAYSALNDKTFARTDECMEKYKDRLDCSNVYLLNKSGEVIAKSSKDEEKGAPDFSRTRYNQLRSVFNEGLPSDPFEITKKDGDTFRYYAAKMDDDTEVVIEKNTKEITEIKEYESDWARLLKPYRMTEDSFVCLISNLTGQVLYNTEGSSPKDTAATYNMGENIFQEKTGLYKEADTYYGVVWLKDRQLYVVNVTPAIKVHTYSDRLIGAIILLLFVILFLMTLAKKKKDAIRIGIAGTGILFFVSFYMACLYGMSWNQYKNALSENMEGQISQAGQEYKETIKGYFDGLSMKQAKACASILGNNPDLRVRKEIDKISKTLKLDYILVYNKDMDEVATNSDYVNLNLSKEEDDPFYSLTKLRFGVSDQVWGPAMDPITGNYHQYFGVTLKEDGEPRGFILASVVPEDWRPDSEKALKASEEKMEAASESAEKEEGLTAGIRDEALEKSLLFTGIGLFVLALFMGLIVLLKGPGAGSVSSGKFLKYTAGALSLYVSLLVLVPRNFIGEYSVLHTVLSGKWNHKPGIYALTACLLAAGLAAFIMAAAGMISRLLASASGKEGGQIIRIAGRLVQILAGLLLFAFCLKSFGLSPYGMAAIGALLLIVMAFGGKSVPGDIMAGFYILFSGLVHVGDEIKSGDQQGRVEEICLTRLILENEKKEKVSIANRQITGNSLIRIKSGKEE